MKKFSLSVLHSPIADKLPDQPTREKNGILVLEIEPQTPKHLHRIAQPILKNPQVEEVHFKRQTQLTLGGAWQGTLVAPIPSAEASHLEATHYRVQNIWLKLIRHQAAVYTFRIQSAFVVPLPQVVYLYQQNSHIVIEQSAVLLQP